MKNTHKVKLALLAALALVTVTLCVNYINKPDPIEKETQHVPTQVVRERDIIETRPEPITKIKKYGGIAYDFEKLNPIQAK
jgi:hypothetical protein